MADRILNQFEVLLVDLDPTVGSEIRKTRPCVVISPKRMNKVLRTVIVAPMTSKGFVAPFRAEVSFNDVDGKVLLDHMRSVDKKRVAKKMGKLASKDALKVHMILQEMFA